MDGLMFVINHSAIWVDIKSILALVFLVAVVVFFAARYHKVRKVEKGLEEEMRAAGLMPAADSTPTDAP